MNGKLDENGSLIVMRGERWKQMQCPYRPRPCGDDCPMFTEPNAEKSGYVFLNVCHALLVFDEFTDRRGKYRA